MALQEQRIAFKLAGGVETKLDSKAVPAVRLTDLKNGVFVKGAAVRKRNGYAALGRQVDGTDATYANARALGQRGSELVLFSDDHAYSYRPASDTWSDTGAVVSVSPSEEPIARTGTAQTYGDHATNAGVTVVAWEDSRGGIWWTLLEDETGRVLRAAAQLTATGARPRCVAVGQVLHVYYADATVGRIYVLVVNPAEPMATVSAAILIDDLLAGNPTFDAVPTTYDATAPALMAWNALAGIRVGYITPGGVVGSPASSLPTAGTFSDAEATTITGPLAVAYEGGNATHTGGYVAIVWSRAASVSARIMTKTDLATTVVAYEPDASHTGVRVTCAFQRGGDSSDNSYLWFALEIAGATDRDARVTYGYVNTDAGAATATVRGCGLASRMAADGSTAVLVYVAHAVTYFSTYACLRLSDGDNASTAPTRIVAARTMPTICAGLPSGAYLPSFHDDASDDRIHRVVLPYREQVPNKPGQFLEIGLKRVTLDCDDDQAWQSAQLGRCLYLGGAMLAQYDGRRWAEAGFHYAPDEITTSKSAGGSLTSSTVYGWIVVPEEVNAQGEIDRGPASVPVTVTMGGADTRVTLTIPTIRLTGRTNVRLAVYRSAPDDDSIYYRVSSVDPSASAGSNRYVANDPTVDTVTFVDDMSDALAAESETLYTTGGVLSNDPPPTARALTVSKSRLFWTDPADDNLIRYSQQIADGYGAELTDRLAIAVDPYGGAVTGIAALDDYLVVFKETAIYIVGGDGPLANPSADAASGFTEPALVTSDVGCLRPLSVSATPIGILFQSQKGIYLLGRDRSVSYVGAPVEAYNAQTVRRTVLLPDRTQILLVCDSGRSLLYDYLFQQWSTFTNHEGLSAAVVGGSLYYLRTDDRVFEETPGVYVDDNSQIQLEVTTAWLHLDDVLQGLQLVYHLHLLGARLSAHQLEMGYQVDYVTHWSDPIRVDARAFDGSLYGDGAYGDGVYGGSGEAAYQWRWHLCQPCQSIRFRFRDVEDYGVAGAAYEITELSLIGGVKRQALRPFPAARTT